MSSSPVRPGEFRESTIPVLYSQMGAEPLSQHVWYTQQRTARDCASNKMEGSHKHPRLSSDPYMLSVVCAHKQVCTCTCALTHIHTHHNLESFTKPVTKPSEE